MADLDLSHAAFAGFRLTRRKPIMVLVWGAALFIFSLAASALLALHGGAELAALEAVSRAQTGTPADMVVLRHQVRAFMTASAPAFAAIVPLALVFAALFRTAIWRGVLAPSQGGPGFLRLGMAELRQLAVQLLVAAFFLLAEIVVVIVLIFVAGLVTTASPLGGALLFLILTLAAACAAVVAMVRLSQAGPATFVRRKVQVLSAFSLSKGRFWPMLGAFLLALILSLLVALLGQAISLGVLAAVGGLDSVMKQGPVATSLAQVVSPLALVETVLGAVFGAMQLIVLTAPVADLYRQITGEGEAEPN